MAVTIIRDDTPHEERARLAQIAAEKTRLKWVMVGKANAVFEQARAKGYPPGMLVDEATKAILTMTKSYSVVGEVMQESKYGAYAREHGYPLCALPVGKVEADPPKKKKPDFWKPPM